MLLKHAYNQRYNVIHSEAFVFLQTKCMNYKIIPHKSFEILKHLQNHLKHHQLII